MGKAFAEVLANSKRSTHSLATFRPSTSAGENSQRRAACKARLAKYLLGPAESNLAPVTAA